MIECYNEIEMKEEKEMICPYHDEIKQDLWGDGNYFCESCLLEYYQLDLPDLLNPKENDPFIQEEVFND